MSGYTRRDWIIRSTTARTSPTIPTSGTDALITKNHDEPTTGTNPSTWNTLRRSVTEPATDSRSTITNSPPPSKVATRGLSRENLDNTGSTHARSGATLCHRNNTTADDTSPDSNTPGNTNPKSTPASCAAAITSPNLRRTTLRSPARNRIPGTKSPDNRSIHVSAWAGWVSRNFQGASGRLMYHRKFGLGTFGLSSIAFSRTCSATDVLLKESFISCAITTMYLSIFYFWDTVRIYY